SARDNKIRFDAACARAGRRAETYAHTMIIADETDSAARAKFEYYADGTDYDAISFRVEQASMDVNAPANSTAARFRQDTGRISARGRLIGSYETVAKTLDGFAEAGIDGVMMTFDDFVAGIETFGKHILPLMKCRRQLAVAG